MIYTVTAHLRSGPVIATIEAATFFDAIQAHRRALMKGRTARKNGAVYKLRKIVAVKVDEVTK